MNICYLCNEIQKTYENLMHYVKIFMNTNKIALFTNKMMKRSTR